MYITDPGVTQTRQEPPNITLRYINSPHTLASSGRFV
jgi:hypothetical protein